MDWIVKASAWDVAELGEQDSSLFSSLTGSNTLVDGKNGSTLLNDMGLGRLGDLQDGVMDKSKEQKGLSSLPLPSELKKTHALSCTKKVSCLVDGCLSDLSKCREYHRRHRVCELHSKTPIVIIRGREQRFCQQCSRFHSLGEFDDVKRSCRKRLDGHNRRRRKPQPESLYMSSQSFLSEYRGGSWLQFSMPQTYESNGGISQQTYESNGGISISWPDNNNHNQGLHSGLKKASSATDKEFSILTDTNSEKGIYQSPEVAISAKLVNPSANSISDRSHLTISDHKVTHLEESRCALSLLSTTQIQAVRTTLNPLPVKHDIIHLSQPTCTNLQYNELYPYSYPRVMDDKSVGAVATPGGSNIFDCINDGISPLFQRAV